MISEIHNSDNIEGMRRYPDGYFDLAVVDPPYGINAGKGTGRSIRKAIEKGKIKGGEWDKAIPTEEYFDELFRVSKFQIIFGGNYFPLPTSKSFFIWDKGETMYGRDFAECEFAWVTPDKPAKIYKLSPMQLDRIHPTQKPVKLYSYIYSKYLPNGGKVLDTHLGSGTNRVAADKAGNIDFTAFETDPTYFKDSIKFYNEYKSQLTLF